MPTHDGLGPDDGDCVKNAGAATVQPDKQGTIDPTQMWFAWRSFSQDIELMPQYYDLRFHLLSRPEAVAQHADEQEADCYHAAIMFRFDADRESIGWSFRTDNEARIDARLGAKSRAHRIFLGRARQQRQRFLLQAQLSIVSFVSMIARL